MEGLVLDPIATKYSLFQKGARFSEFLQWSITRKGSRVFGPFPSFPI